MATYKQKALVKKIVENNGNVSKSMRDVGYSENTAKNPKQVRESKGIIAIMEKAGLTDEYLTDKLKEVIDSKKQVTVYGKDGTKTKEINEISNTQTKGLDMAHKIKGSYAPEKKELSGAVSFAELFEE